MYAGTGPTSCIDSRLACISSADVGVFGARGNAASTLTFSLSAAGSAFSERIGTSCSGSTEVLDSLGGAGLGAASAACRTATSGGSDAVSRAAKLAETRSGAVSAETKAEVVGNFSSAPAIAVAAPPLALPRALRAGAEGMSAGCRQVDSTKPACVPLVAPLTA